MPGMLRVARFSAGGGKTIRRAVIHPEPVMTPESVMVAAVERNLQQNDAQSAAPRHNESGGVESSRRSRHRCDLHRDRKDATLRRASHDRIDRTRSRGWVRAHPLTGWIDGRIE